MGLRTATVGLALLTATASAVTPPTLLRARERQLQRQRLGAPPGVAAPPDQWYNQTLDHFDVLRAGTWQQRFWTSEQYWKGSGPLFLYVEGEGAGSPYDVLSGQHVELAANHSALVIALEHRFYGASIPTADLSTDSLSLLSSHQSIADISRFLVEYVAVAYPNVTAVVTFGGSYPGALSAWTRLRLPHLVWGAFSTSSPVQAVADFYGYNDVVAASLSSPLVGGSPACLTAVKAAFVGIDAALRGPDANKTAISTLMSSCAPALSDNDVMWMATNLAGQIMGVVQYNDEAGGLDVKGICSTMTAPGADPLQAMASVIKQSLGGQPCMDNSYTDFIAQLRNVTVDKSAGGVGVRSWTWQTCSQFGYYQSCDAGSDCPFSTLMTLDSNYQICVDGFDMRVDQAVNVDRINFTNDYLGGKTLALPGTSSRILWVNGGIDPWHWLSLLPSENANPQNAAVLIPSGAHCLAMQPSRDSDPADVKAARLASAAVLDGWLAAAAEQGASLAAGAAAARRPSVGGRK